MKKNIIIFMLHAAFFFLHATTPRNRSMKRFGEAQLLLSNHKTCLTRSIFEKNVPQKYTQTI